MQAARTTDDQLRHEAELFGRHLIGASPDAALAERYARGCRELFTEPAPPHDAAVVTFCCRHPRALPFLDAAAGVLGPRSLLRQKLVLMTAVLETTPRFTKQFAPPPRSATFLVLEVGLLLAREALRGALGVVLWGFVRRRA